MDDGHDEPPDPIDESEEGDDFIGYDDSENEDDSDGEDNCDNYSNGIQSNRLLYQSVLRCLNHSPVVFRTAAATTPRLFVLLIPKRPMISVSSSE
jgi:hypothetical protein